MNKILPIVCGKERPKPAKWPIEQKTVNIIAPASMIVIVNMMMMIIIIIMIVRGEKRA